MDYCYSMLNTFLYNSMLNASSQKSHKKCFPISRFNYNILTAGNGLISSYKVFEIQCNLYTLHHVQLFQVLSFHFISSLYASYQINKM